MKPRKPPIPQPKRSPAKALAPAAGRAGTDAQAVAGQLASAVALHQQGRLDEAAAIYNEVLRAQPDHFDALQLLGTVAAQSGKAADAAALYERALNINPNHPDTLNNQGNVLRGLGRLPQALESYDKALALAPGYAAALSNRGNVLADMQRLDEALDSYDQAIHIRPDFAEALSQRGRVLWRLKRLPQALDSYERAIKLAPRDAEAMGNRANVLRELQRYGEALEAYDRTLQLQPDSAATLSNRAAVLLDLKRPLDALDSAERALRVDGSFAQAHNNRGNALQALDRHEEALASFERAVALNPLYADAFNNRGNALRRLKRPQEALESFDRAIALRPGYAQALSNRGNALRDLKRLEEALASYDQALQLEPGHVQTLGNRGVVLVDLARPQDALDSYSRALQVQPDDAETLVKRGSALQDLTRPQEALENFDRALQINPAYAQALNNRGNALRELKRPEEAIASFDRALQADPGFAEAFSNRGVVLQDRNRLEEALASYDRALELRPVYAQALSNRGNVLRELLRTDESLESYARSLALDPDCAEAHWNEALCRLVRGEYAVGWQKYEWRWKKEPGRSKAIKFDKPLWLGEQDLQGKTILLHAEQGLGDTLQFCRYAAQVAALGAQVVLEVQPALKGLLQGLPGIKVIGQGEHLPDFDYHCPLLSLPLAFKADLGNISGQAYLHSDPARLAQWQERLGPAGKPRIGVVWSGSTGHLNDHNRSMDLQEFQTLLQSQQVDWYGLQKEIRPADQSAVQALPRFKQLGAMLQDFGDTAAAIELMDLVITVDTSVAHLAGAMGKEVWVLLAHSPDWRWLLNRSDSPWYASARLFRQTQRGDWAGVLQQVQQALQTRLGDGKEKAAQQDPSVVADKLARALVLHQQGELDKAEALYKEILTARPRHFDALQLLAVVAAQSNRPDQAVELFERALQINPGDPGMLNNYGNALGGQGKLAEALACFDRALKIAPDYAEALSNRGRVLADLGRLEQALESHDHALRIRPNYAESLSQRGKVLWMLQRPEEALDSYDLAVKLAPGDAEAWCNRANVLRELHRFTEALDGYKRSLQLQPDSAQALSSLATFLLVRGDYAPGWEKYESRWKKEPGLSRLRNFAQPLWMGEQSLQGKTILLHAEQGLGDTLQFCRYAAQVAELGAQVVLEVQPPLKGLMQSLKGTSIVMGKGETLPHFDYHCPLLSLPLAFKADLGNISGQAYLHSDPVKRAQWQERLGPAGKPRIGLVWSGNAQQGDDHRRSMAFEQVRGLVGVQAEYFCLQKEIRALDRPLLDATPGIRFLGDALEDFSDTAAVVDQMDLVITTCTSVAHLAGAMGKEVWVLLAHSPDWRWLLNRSDSPWYASARLFRQTQRGDWAGVLQQVQEALALRLGDGKEKAAQAVTSVVADKLARALALHQKGNLDKAETLYKEILTAQPRHFAALQMLATVAAHRKDNAAAVALFGHALMVKPDHVGVLNDLGNALRAQGKMDEALQSYGRALEIEPDFVDALVNRGNAWRSLQRVEEALASYERALQTRPDHPEVLNNRGVALQDLLRPQEALASYQQAWRVKPDYAEAHWNEALCQLLLGDFAQGWPNYEWRWKRRAHQEQRRDFAQPLWLGRESLQGKTILLYGEQGLGDTIQFCRYVGQVAALGARVVLEVQPSLKDLLGQLEGAGLVLGRGERLPDFDVHCPLLSLPLAFKADLGNINGQAYLHSDPVKLAEWKERLGAASKPRIGLVWSGSTGHQNDHNRSLRLQDMTRLAGAQVDLYGLQKELRPADRAALADTPHLTFLGDSLADFNDTAAALELMDIVITVDTSVAHLAGAMGKEVWILLPFSPDWRWLLGRSDSPWYASARLFRQPATGDWASVMTQVREALAERLGGAKPESVQVPRGVADKLARALALHQKGELAKAEAVYREILAAQPRHADVLQLLGTMEVQRSQPASALVLFDRALEINPGDATALSNRAAALLDLDRAEEALKSAELALRTRPDYAEALNNRGNALWVLKRSAEAVDSFDHALKLKPDYPEAWSNRGAALRSLRRPAEALESYNEAIRLKPDYAGAMSNQGAALQDLNRLPEAVQSYARAQQLRPDHAEAHMNEAMCRLLMGDFAVGWKKYEWRWKKEPGLSLQRKFSQPLWLGKESLAHKIILLHAEQGQGDTIQFCRYVRQVAALGARVVLEVQPSLRDLLGQLEGAGLVLGRGERLPDFDVHCPLLSLPLAFKADLSNINGQAYLHSDAEKLAQWQARLGPATRKRVGLIWSGSTGHQNDDKRSLALDDVRCLLSDQYDSYCLQKALRPADRAALADTPHLTFLGDSLADFNDTAAALELMDIVITVDTSVAHLAGAMGKEVWILLPFSPDWRWLLERSDSPWYASARLFRQPVTGDWASVMTQVREALTARLAALEHEPRPAPVLRRAADATQKALAAQLTQAMALHQQGQLDQAARLYEAMLQMQPQHFDALQLLAMVRAQTGQPGAAAALFEKALAIQAGHPDVLNNYGNVLRALQRPAEALACYDRALQARPDHAEALSNRGNALQDLQRYGEALDSYDEALRLRPEFAEALHHRANTLRALNRPVEALESYERALKITPGHAEALGNRANALRDLGRTAEALESYELALKSDPRSADALSNRGVVLLELKRPQEALESCDSALRLRPDFAEALCNRGACLQDLARPAEALVCYDRALQLKPAYPEAWSNRGSALRALKRPQEALQCWAEALRLKSDYVGAHWNEGLCRLVMGEYAAGWQKYEWRWKKEPGLSRLRNFAQPLWLGEQSLQGKTILLHAEQGLGDTLQFCRYAAQVAELGAQVVLEVQPPLKGLMQSLKGTSIVIGKGETLPHFDYHCPLLSLPLAFKADLGNISGQAYLHSDPVKRAQWQERLGPAGKPRIGLVWSGNIEQGNDKNRSMSFEDIQPLLDGRAEYLCLQKELRPADRVLVAQTPGIRFLGDIFEDFSDTAAVIDLMDVVITVDTSVAHLAAAMGKETWILLTYSPDWRWLLEGQDCPWYSSARLFRQATAGDWAAVVVQVKEQLRLRYGQASQRTASSLNAAIALHQQGQLEQAEAAYRDILQELPQHVDALNMLATLAAQQNNLPRALALFEQVISLDPQHAAALNNYGNTLRSLQRHGQALEIFDRALAIHPDSLEALVNRASVLWDLKKPEQALAAYDRALLVEPHNPDFWSDRANVLWHLKRHQEALESCERALQLRPDFAAALSNRGNALRGLQRPEEALASYDRTLQIAPNHADALSNRGVALVELLRPQEALASYERALQLRPDYAETHWNKALCQLLLGDYVQGWPDYEWRWKRELNKNTLRSFTQALWLGEQSLQDKTILLHAEQGLGDTLQFCRYAAQVVALGAQVVLEVQPALKGLLQGLPGIKVIGQGEHLPDFDYHCPLLSLPLAFKADLGNISGQAYLHSDPARLAQWQERLGPAGKPRIGVVWSGSTGHLNDHNRSMDLQEFQTLLQSQQADWYGLQKEIRPADQTAIKELPQFKQLGAMLQDFGDTAAAIELMDLVITVDTSVAHLAGAMGKEVWLLLAHSPDWRWLLKRSDSPWYASARLFRQTQRGDWAGVLEQVQQALQTRLATA